MNYEALAKQKNKAIYLMKIGANSCKIWLTKLIEQEWSPYDEDYIRNDWRSANTFQYFF